MMEDLLNACRPEIPSLLVLGSKICMSNFAGNEK